MWGICRTGRWVRMAPRCFPFLGWRLSVGAVLLAHHPGPCKAGTETQGPAPSMALGAIFKAH